MKLVVTTGWSGQPRNRKRRTRDLISRMSDLIGESGCYTEDRCWLSDGREVLYRDWLADHPDTVIWPEPDPALALRSENV